MLTPEKQQGSDEAPRLPRKVSKAKGTDAAIRLTDSKKSWPGKTDRNTAGCPEQASAQEAQKAPEAEAPDEPRASAAEAFAPRNGEYKSDKSEQA